MSVTERRWDAFDVAVALTGVVVTAAVFVGVLVYNRVLFCIAAGVVASNVVTWLVTRSAMRAEAEAARARADAIDLTPAGGQPSVPGLDPPKHPNPSRPFDPSEAPRAPDHVDVWRTLADIGRRLG